MSTLEHFHTVDLPTRFKTLHDSFIQAQSKQPTDIQHILRNVDDRILKNTRKLESKLESLPAAAHVVQMIHDETKIHDLVQRIDDAERAIFEYSQSIQTDTRPTISQDAISAMVNTRMVSYNARDKDELLSILANQRRALEDIESRLRHLDDENDARIEAIIDTRMQRNTIIDQHQPQLLLSTHQSNLQQTSTDTLTTIQTEKDAITLAFTTERKKLVSNQQPLLTEVQTQYKDLKEKLSTEIKADFLACKQKHLTDFNDLTKQLDHQASNLYT
jgi:hypothetical protein